MNPSFEIEYTDRKSGVLVVMEVSGADAARQLARELAMASGKRAIVRRSPNRQWRVFVADVETGEVTPLDQKLTTREAAIMFKNSNRRAQELGMVCLYWPHWAPVINIQLSHNDQREQSKDQDAP